MGEVGPIVLRSDFSGGVEYLRSTPLFAFPVWTLGWGWKRPLPEGHPTGNHSVYIRRGGHSVNE